MPTPRSRDPGSTAKPLTAAIRERRLTSSHDIDPAGSPSVSITSTPKPSGSRCERATRSAIASVVDARETARNGCTSASAASAARNGTSSSVAGLRVTSTPPRYPRRSLAPVPSAVPPRIRTRPTSADAVTASSRNTVP